MTLSEFIAKDPVTASTFISQKFNAVLKFILSDSQPLGKVTRYFVRIEYQSRLTPHYHCVFWIDGAPIINKSSDDEVINFISKHIFCRQPHSIQDPEMANLVSKYQSHHCNKYCKTIVHNSSNTKYTTVCTFGFPRVATTNLRH